MIGLLFLITLGLWVWGGYWLAFKIGGQVKPPRWRGTVQWSIFAALMFAPFADEVVGKWQLEQLCRSNGIESVDLNLLRGRTVGVRSEQQRQLARSVLRTEVRVVQLRDTRTGQPLTEFAGYYSHGGWLMRYTWLGMGSSSAMLFPGDACGQTALILALQKAQITVVKRELID